MNDCYRDVRDYPPEDVIMVTKSSNGDLMWLEKGNEEKGLSHILENHEKNFQDQGYGANDIPALLQTILGSEPIRVFPKNGGLEAVYHYNGHNYTVGYGTNGYIVSFYPSKAKKR